MRAIAAGWRDGQLTLLGADGPWEPGLPVEPELRQSIALAEDKAGRLFLRVPGLVAPWWRLKPERGRLGPLPALPGEHPFSRWKLHPDSGCWTVLGERELHLLEGETWRSIPLPAALEVKDIALSPDRSRIWAVGARRDRDPDEGRAAMAIFDASSSEWKEQPLRLSQREQAWALEQGGLDGFRSIELCPNGVVLTELSAFFVEDASSFAYWLGQAGPNRVLRLEGDMPRRVLREAGATVLLSSAGKRVQLDPPGAGPAEDLQPAIASALDAPGHSIQVRDADARGSALALAVEVAPEDRRSLAEPGEGSAILLSTHRGWRFQVIRRDSAAEGIDWSAIRLLSEGRRGRRAG